MTRPPSLRARLAWWATVVVACWLTVLTVGANLLLGVALGRQADSLLRARAEATAATVQARSDGTLGVAGDTNDAALDVGTWIFAKDGTVIEQPPSGAAGLNRLAANLAGHGSGVAETGLTNRIRLMAVPITDGTAHLGTVVTSTSLAPYQQLRRLAWAASAVLGLGMLVVVHLVLRANVARALRPVQQMTVQAGRWSADDVHRRFGDEPRPAELDALAHTWDAVLDRLSAVLRHERQLTDELSHELRTPLARMQGELDLLRSKPRSPQEQHDALAAIDEAAASMRQIIDTLITTARSTNGIPTGRCAPGSVVTALSERLREQRPEISIFLDVPPGLTVGVDPAVLERLLSPILENALRYAATRVSVRAEPAEGVVLLRITDDGPGLAAELTEQVFAPGWRADPADGHPGAGLGLALARRLAVAAGGQVTGFAGPGGEFEIELPAG